MKCGYFMHTVLTFLLFSFGSFFPLFLGFGRHSFCKVMKVRNAQYDLFTLLTNGCA